MLVKTQDAIYFLTVIDSSAYLVELIYNLEERYWSCEQVAAQETHRYLIRLKFLLLWFNMDLVTEAD